MGDGVPNDLEVQRALGRIEANLDTLIATVATNSEQDADRHRRAMEAAEAAQKSASDNATETRRLREELGFFIWLNRRGGWLMKYSARTVFAGVTLILVLRGDLSWASLRDAVKAFW